MNSQTVRSIIIVSLIGLEIFGRVCADLSLQSDNSYPRSLVDAVEKSREIGGMKGCDKFAIELSNHDSKLKSKAQMSKVPVLNVLLAANDDASAKQIVANYVNECMEISRKQRKYENLYTAEAMRYQTMLSLFRALKYIASQVDLNLVPEPDSPELRWQMPEMSDNEQDEPEFVRKSLSTILRQLKRVDSNYPFDLPGTFSGKHLQDRMIYLDS